METSKIVGASVIGAVLLVGGAIAGASMFPVTNTVTVEHNNTVNVPVEKIVYQDKIVEKIVNQTVTVDVPVDNGNLNTVLQYVYDENGNINYLVDDLKEKEMNQIVDRIVFVNDVKAIAVGEVEDRAFDELDRMDVGTVRLDNKDMSRLRIKDEYSDINVTDIDFDNKDSTVMVSTTFENDEVKYDAVFEVAIKDNKFDDIRVDSVTLH